VVQWCAGVHLQSNHHSATPESDDQYDYYKVEYADNAWIFNSPIALHLIICFDDSGNPHNANVSFLFLSLGKYNGDETAMCIHLGLLCCQANVASASYCKLAI
jgi:hypothetical protein